MYLSAESESAEPICVELHVQLVFPTRYVRKVETARCLLTSISEKSATLSLGHLQRIPDHFYMQFNDDDSDLHTCFVTERNGASTRCSFLYPLEPHVVEKVIAGHRLMSALDEIWSAGETRHDHHPASRPHDGSPPLHALMGDFWEAIRRFAARRSGDPK